MKSLKTPLRYPGVNPVCTKLDQFLPDLRDYTEYREPFLGGGSVAIHVTKKYPRLNIWVNDLYEPLTNYSEDFSRMMDVPFIKDYKNWKSRYPDEASAKGLFLEAKDVVNDYAQPNLFRATAFCH